LPDGRKEGQGERKRSSKSSQKTRLEKRIDQEHRHGSSEEKEKVRKNCYLLGKKIPRNLRNPSLGNRLGGEERKDQGQGDKARECINFAREGLFTHPPCGRIGGDGGGLRCRREKRRRNTIGVESVRAAGRSRVKEVRKTNRLREPKIQDLARS